MIPHSPTDFQWLSPLGLSAAIFLGYGVLNVLVGLAIPFLHRSSRRPEPAPYIIDMWAFLLLAFGVFQIYTTWYGLQAENLSAALTLAVADVSQLTGWILYGRRTRDWGAPLFLYPAIFLLPAFVLAWIGLR